MKRPLFSIFTAALSGHELSVFGGGGLSTLSYSPAVGSSAEGAGGQVGLGYAYHFSDRWGVVTGVGLSFHRASAEVNGAELTTTGLRNRYGYLFDLHAILAGHHEVQQASFLNIPLQARFSAGPKPAIDTLLAAQALTCCGRDTVRMVDTVFVAVREAAPEAAARIATVSKAETDTQHQRGQP
ncbi:MAG: hypothetical protein LBS63_02575 [Prevotellaceae bacterium]|jgi:hypothetical protein|nr:hypothetical protein [Prevotellaceae bacterium]